MTRKVNCYIALGSNLDDPIKHVTQAITELGRISETQLITASSLYRTTPVGPPQDDYINAVVHIETTLSAQALLTALQALEHQHQRVRTEHWGPRTLDCDILLFGDAVINEDNLIVPHPRMLERAFVMIPLAEIAKDLILPSGKPITTYSIVKETTSKDSVKLIKS